MAPELFDGKGFDSRVDVFAASVVLWECLTQRRLFKRKTNVEMIRAVCLDPRVPPSTYTQDIPRELDRLVLQGLEVDPRKRVQSAHEMQAGLLDLLRRMKPHLQTSEVRGMIRGMLDEPPEEAEDLIIDVVEEDPTEVPQPQREAPIIELSPWDIVSDSGTWATPTPDVEPTRLRTARLRRCCSILGSPGTIRSCAASDHSDQGADQSAAEQVGDRGHDQAAHGADPGEAGQRGDGRHPAPVRVRAVRPPSRAGLLPQDDHRRDRTALLQRGDGEDPIAPRVPLADRVDRERRHELAAGAAVPRSLRTRDG